MYSSQRQQAAAAPQRPVFPGSALAILPAAILIATLGPTAFAQTASTPPAALQGEARITGVVRAQDRDVRLVGATVSIDAINLTATTDSEGRFTIRRLAPGTYDVLVRYVDRAPFVTTVQISGDETETLDVRLERLGRTAGLEEVVVTGRLIADSEAAALSRQRAADSVKNILAADSIGRFPDQNAADALGRVAGISVERDQGQARFVNVRGAPADFTNIAFNGVAAPTPSRGGRSARFDTVSNNVIKSIEVVKAVTPDIPADSIGGFINVETNGAFDRPGLNLDVAVGTGIKELGGGRLNQAQITFSNTFFDETVGLLLSADTFEDNRLVDNVEGDFSVVDGQLWPREVDWRNYRGKRENNSLNARFDWRPVDRHGFYVNFVSSEFSVFEIRDKHEYEFSDSVFGHPSSRGGFDAGSDPVRGTIIGLNLDTDFNIRTDVESIATLQFGGESDFEGFSLDWVGGFNRSRSEREPDSAYFDYEIERARPTSDEDPTPRNPSISTTYDRTNPDFPILKVYETIVNPDGTLGLGPEIAGPPSSAFRFQDVETSDTLGQVDEYFFQFDVERPWAPFGITSDLKLGGRVSYRNATLEDTDLEVNADFVAGSGIDAGYETILSDRLTSLTFPQPAMFEVSQDKVFAKRDELFAAARAANAVITQSNVWENFYDVDENVFALYAMNTFRWDKFDIIVGARVEYTDMSGIGNEPIDEDAIDDILEAGSSRGVSLGELYAARDADGNPILRQVEAEQDYIDFFPAVHFNYRHTEDLVVRLAYTQSILRPSYSQFAPNREVGDESDLGGNGVVFISGGNPELEPYRSRNLDFYVERYLPYRGILSFGLFAKWIDDPIFGSTQSRDGAAFGFPGSEVRLSGPLNGSDGEIRGFEATYSQQFGFLPEPWDGFGVSLNYTYSEDSAETPPLFNPETGRNDGASRSTGLKGASERTYNTSVFFEKYGVSTRLSYQYRSPWLNSIDLGQPLLDRFWDARPSLDLSLRYSINENFLLYIDANNLTDERGRRYRDNDNFVYELEGFGASYLAGIRFTL